MKPRRLFKILLKVFATLLLLVVLLLVALHQPAVQRWLTPKLEAWLTEKLHTRLSIEGVGVRFPKALEIKGVEIWTPDGDSLLQVGSLVVDMDMLALLDNQVVLQEVMLEDANIHLLQADGMANFDFILQAFAAPPQTEAAPKPADGKAGFQLSLSPASVHLKNVVFDWQNLDEQQFINAKVGALELEVTADDLEQVSFEVKQFLLSDAAIIYRDLGPPAPDTATTTTAFEVLVKNAEFQRSRVLFETNELRLDANLTQAVVEDFSIKSGKEGLGIVAKALDMADSDLALHQASATATPGRFNAADFALKGLDARLADFSYQNQALNVEVTALSGQDKSGLDVQRLKGKLAYSPTELSLQNLDLQANTTTMRGKFLLRLDPTGKTPLSYLEADLGRSQGIVSDLLRFLPPSPALKDLEKMANTRWSVEGRLKGNLEAMEARGFRLHVGQHTHLYCNGSLNQLSDLNKLGGNLQIGDLQFDKNDFTPYLKGKNLLLPAFANLAGRVDGRAGNLQLQLAGYFGNLDSLAVAPVRTDTAYFDLAGTVSGLANTGTLRLDMDVRRFEATGRQFANFVPKTITLPERMAAKGKLKGSLAQLNANLQLHAVRGGEASDLSLVGDLGSLDKPKELRFDLAFKGEVTRQELFGYVPDSLVTPHINLPARLVLDGRAKGRTDDLVANLDLGLGQLGDMTVEATLKAEQYTAKLQGTGLKMDRLMTDSLLNPLKNIDLDIDLSGNGFDVGKTATAQVKGEIKAITWDDWNLENIGIEGKIDGEVFSANVVSPDPRLHLTLSASGKLDDQRPTLQWDASFDCLDLDAIGLTNKNTKTCFRFRGDATGLSLDQLDATAYLENMDLQYEATHVRPGDLTIKAVLQNGSNNLSLASKWLNARLVGSFELAMLPLLVEDILQHYFQTKPESHVATPGNFDFEMNLTQPDLFESGLVPGLNSLDTLSMSGKFDAATHRFDFTTTLPSAGYEQWVVKGLALHANGNGNTANIRMDIPGVRQYNEAFARNLLLEAQLDGKLADARISIPDSTGRERFRLAFFAESAEFKNGYALHFSPQQLINYGVWTVPDDNSISYEGELVSIKHLHLESGEQALQIDGATKLQAGKNQALDFTVGMKHLNLNNFDPFLAGILSNMEGWLDGNVRLGGTVAAPKPSGSLSLTKAKMTIEMTKVRYAISDVTFDMTPKGIEFGEFYLTDPRNKRLTVKGGITTSDWVGLQYNLRLASTEWMLLNTTKNDGIAYYGQLSAKIDGTVRGPLTQPNISLTATPVEGSVLNYIYDAASGQSGRNGLVVFTEANPTNQKRQKESSKRYPFHLNLNLDLTDDLEVNIVTDPVSGDNFVGNLEGRLSLEIFPDGKMNLAGRTDVKKGTYRFTYQQVVKRIFKVSPDSYIAWTGDPLNPEIQVTARFVVRTSPYPLLAASQSIDDPTLKDFQTFFVNFNVTGTALAPKLDIKLEYPDNDELTGENVSNSGNDAITAAIETLNQDEAALSQQVFGLLIFQQFLGDTGGAASAGQGTLGRGLSDFLANQFNVLADQYLKFVDVSLDVSEDAVFGDDNQYVGSTNYNLQLQKTFFNDRLVFKVSGVATEEHGTQSEVRSSLNNASVEYLLKPNGNLKIRAFTEDGLEIFDSEAIRNSGAGFIYTKEYKRLFKRKK